MRTALNDGSEFRRAQLRRRALTTRSALGDRETAILTTGILGMEAGAAGVRQLLDGIKINGGRYWVRTSDLFGVKHGQ